VQRNTTNTLAQLDHFSLLDTLTLATQLPNSFTNSSLIVHASSMLHSVRAIFGMHNTSWFSAYVFICSFNSYHSIERENYFNFKIETKNVTVVISNLPMTSPNANDIEANNNANNANNANNQTNYSNANNANNANLVPESSNRENSINRIRVPPLLVINQTNLEDDALPTGFEPFEIQTFLNFVDIITPLRLPISLNNDEI